MRNILLICLFLGISMNGYAQNQQILDSLNRIYKTTPQDTTKILVLADIAYLYYLQFDTCLLIAQKGIDLSEK